MKKNGFTLAEVLITLTIIGVVAVLTLPNLLANTQEQQARAALKKMTNTLTLGAQMNAAIAGFDFSGITVASEEGLQAGRLPNNDNDHVGSLLVMLTERTNFDPDLGYNPPQGTPRATTAVYMKDGTAIYFSRNDTVANGSIFGQTLPDGAMRGIPVIFDTNGAKRPNQLSTCIGQAATDWADDDDGDCEDKGRRFIRDQFMFKLRGNFVAPVGSASAWMLDEQQFTAGEYQKAPATDVN